jgi:hypothetical protein
MSGRKSAVTRQFRQVVTMRLFAVPINGPMVSPSGNIAL